MRRTVFFIFLVMLLFVSAPVLALDTYYVQSLKAKIMSSPSFKAKALGEAGKGTRLVSSGREGSWVKVTFSKNEGYVPALLLSKYPPIDRLSYIKGNDTEIKQSVRRRASTYTSAAAARGLAQDDRRRLSTEDKLDYGGLEKVEAVTVSSEEVSRFMEGKLL